MKNTCLIPDYIKLKPSITFLILKHSDDVNTLSEKLLQHVLKKSVLNDSTTTVKNIAEETPNELSGLLTQIAGQVMMSKPEYFESGVLTQFWINPAASLYEQLKSTQSMITPIEDDKLEKKGVGNTPANSELPTDGDSQEAIERVEAAEAEQVPEDSRVFQKLGSQSMKEITDFYLIDGLESKIDILEENFRQLISRNWLSTKASKQGEYAFDTDSIRKDIKTDAGNTITNYYSSSADAIGTIDAKIRNENAALTLLLFENKNRMPGTRRKINTFQKNDVEITFYKHNYALDENGKQVIFASVSSLDILEDTALLQEAIQSIASLKGDRTLLSLEPTPTSRLIETLKPPAVNRDNVIDNHENPEFLNAYFAYAIYNELDTLIKYYAKMLDSTYVEKYRIGHDEVDKEGTGMANKMTKLGIISTPMVFADSDLETAYNKWSDIGYVVGQSGKEIHKILSDGSYLKSINQNGNKAFKFTNEGTDYIGLALNFGSASVVVVQSKDENGVEKWQIPMRVSPDSELKFYDLVSDIAADVNAAYNSKLNPDYSLALTEATTELVKNFVNNNNLNKLLNEVGTVPYSINKVLEIVESTNQPMLGAVETINLSTTSGVERFLTEQELTMASSILQDIPRDPDQAGTFLRNLMDERSNRYARVAKALYYRYFHKGEYNITDINPINGLLETITHTSIYEQALRYNKKVAWDAVNSLLSNTASTVIDNKVYMANGTVIETKVEKEADIDFLASNVDYNGTIKQHNGSFTLAEDVESFFDVEGQGSDLTVHFYEYGKTVFKTKADPTVSFSINKNGILLDDDGLLPMSLEVLRKMSDTLRLPYILTDNTFYEAFYDSIASTSETDPKASLQTFYAKLVLLRLANVSNEDGSKAFDNITLVTSSQDKQIPYRFMDNLYEYKDVLIDTLDKTYGRSFRAKIVGPDGAEFAASIIRNLSKEKRLEINDVIEKLRLVTDKDNSDYLYKNSNLLNGVLTVMGNGISKLGIGVGFEGKSNDKLSQQEQAVFLVESFLQHASKNEFKEALSQEGTMSDRSKIDLFAVTLTTEVLPKHTLDNGTIILNEDKLRKDYFDTQTKSFSSLQDNVVINWQKVLARNLVDANLTIGNFEALTLDRINDIETLRDVHNLLKELRLDYKEVLRKTPLTDHLALTKGPDGQATIKYSMVRLSEIALAEVPAIDGVNVTPENKEQLQKNLELKNYFLDMYYHDFMQYMKDVNFRMSDSTQKIIEERFPYIKNMDETLRYTEAEKLLLKTFFYQDSIVEQELIQFGMGTVFQYKSKVNSMMEFIDPQTTDETTASEKLKLIADYDFGNGVTIKNTTFDEFEDMGPSGNRPGFIKAIYEAKNLNAEEKIQFLEFDDIFSQVSPMYIDRVKRNQASGTSGQTYVMANNTRGGFYMDQKTKTILVTDPERYTDTLGSGRQLMEIYNGSEFLSASYMYKHNNSLGDKFNNYRATGIIKTVNTSKNDDGVAVYEKLAGFPMFNYEVMVYAEPEHNNVHEFMMRSVPFNESDTDAGIVMYLDENPLAPKKSEIYKTEIKTAQEFLNHGEYLGMVQMTDTKGNTKIIHAASILYDIESGKLTIDQLNKSVIKTTKVAKIMKNKLDLYNYYGGTRGNITKYNQVESAKDKTSFIDDFPYGWVEYQIGHIMTHYRGESHNYPIRNAEVNKVIFSSAVKTGITYANSPSIITDRNTKHEDISVHEVSNKYLGTVLKPEHNYDTTSEFNMSEEIENNNIAMMTQVTSAAVAQGETQLDVEMLYNAIGDLSFTQLEKIKEEVESYNDMSNDTDATSQKHYLVNLARKTLETRANAELTKEFVGIDAKDVDSVAIDMKMLLPFMRSVINAEYNRKAVKLRFKGGQVILAPIENQIKTYTYNGAKGLLRSAISSDNSINGLIRNEIETNGISSLDADWTLVPVTNIDELKSQHTMLDYVYVKEGDSYTYKEVNDLLKNEKETEVLIKNQALLSPWLGTGSKTNETLQWMNYFKDGVSLYETDDYQSYMLAGKIPKDLVELDKARQVVVDKIKQVKDAIKIEKNSKVKNQLTKTLQQLEKDRRSEGSLVAIKNNYFRNLLKSKVPAVPKGLWARYIVSTNSLRKLMFGKDSDHLDYSPVLSDGIINQAYTAYESNDKDAINGFFKWLESYEGTEQELTNIMKPNLVHTLEQDGWQANETEFYMPPMHQAGFLIDNGDNMQDIVGMQEQPELVKLASITDTELSQQLLNKEEILLLETNYVHDETNDVMVAIKTKIESKGGDVGEKYLQAREAQQDAMLDYFELKINNLEKLAQDKLTKTEFKAFSRRSPLFLLNNIKGRNTSEKGSNAVKTLDKLLNTSDIIENQTVFDMLLNLKTVLNNQGFEIFSTKVQDSIEIFKTQWTTNLANNFEKSLTFITSRIPAQGKQSTTVGKVKNFIFSTKNAIYGPLELFAMTGADYDVDKQNNITWDIDSTGKIVEWVQYLDSDGSFNIKKFKTQLKEEERVLIEKLTRLNYSDEDNKAMVRKFRVAKMDRITKSVQNFVLQKLIHISKDSKNAMEAATMVAMNKLNLIRDYLDSFNFSKLEIEEFKLETFTAIDENGNEVERVKPSEALVEAIKKRQYALPYSPSTKMLYEKVNMDGKMGIAIYASGIKAYFAAYYAWLSNDNVVNYNSKVADKQLNELLESDPNKLNEDILNEIPESDETDIIKFKLKEDDIGEIADDLPDEVQRDKNSFYFIWKDPETGLYDINPNISTLANTEKYMPDVKGVLTRLNSQRAKSAYKRLLRQNGDWAKEAVVLKEFMEPLLQHQAFSDQSQAWADLSELLTAATDNAKELVLSKIGSNNTTSSIIATMVAMGIDLKAALTIINDEGIQKVIKEMEEDNSLVIDTPEFTKGFLTRLSDEINTHENTSPEPDEVIKSKILKNLESKGLLGTMTDVEINSTVTKELIRQKKLYKHSNPYKQINLYGRAARELTLLSGILKINTGMVNSEVDALNYLLKVEKAFGWNSAKKAPYTLTEFIAAQNDPTAMMEIIDSAEKAKTAFNVPYILYKNKHYFAYLKAFNETTETLVGLSYKTDILYNNILDKLKDIKKTKIESYELRQYNDTMDDIAISTYYQSASVNSKINIEGFEQYDLANSSETDGIKGRYEFMQDFPQVILEDIKKQNPHIADNPLIRKLGGGELITDKATGESIMVLTGINARLLTEGDTAKYRRSLENLKDSTKGHPALYNALFNYSLIMDKGGFGRHSIATLFDKEPFIPYVQHLLKLKGSFKGKQKLAGSKQQTMNEIFADIDANIMNLLIPMTLPEFSTTSGVSNEGVIGKAQSYYKSKRGAAKREAELTDERTQEQVEEQEEAEKKKTKSKFDVSDMNRKSKSKHFISPVIFKSKSNGLVYMKMERDDINSYIPITQDIPKSIININIKPGLNIQRDLKDLGYNWGWKIKLPSGDTARLLRFNKRNYDILTNDNRIIQLPKLTIEEFNPRMSLYGASIRVQPGKFSSKRPKTFFWNSETKELVNEGGPGIQALIVNDDNITYYRGHNKAIYTEKSKNLIRKHFAGKRKSAMISIDNIKSEQYDTSIDTLKEILKAATLVAQEEGLNTFDETLGDLLSHRVTYDKEPTIRKINSFFADVLQKDFGKLYTFLRLSNEDKVNYIKTEVLGDSLLDIKWPEKIKATDVYTQADLENVVRTLKTLSDQKTLFAADIEFLLDEEHSGGLTIDEYTKWLNDLGIDINAYRESIDAKFIVANNKLYKKDVAPVKYSITTKHLVPEPIQKARIRQASPKVLNKLSAFLNKRFKNNTVKVLGRSEIKILYPEVDIENSTDAFINTNGTIILVKEQATLDTLLHEMGHLYLAEIKESNPDLYYDLMLQMKSDPSAEVVTSLYEGKPGYSEFGILEEVFVKKLQNMHSATFIQKVLTEAEEDMGALLTNKDGENLGNITDTFKSIFGDFIGRDIKNVSISMEDSMGDILMKIGTDIIFNENSALHGLTKTDRTEIKKAISNKPLTKTEAIALLRKLGYIKKVCK